MTPEQILAIAASQWTGIPTPSQIIKALEAGGFKIVSTDAEPDFALADLSTKEAQELVGKRLAELRKNKGYTQESLSVVLDCHWITVSKLERAEMQITLDWALRISRALGISINEIFAEVDPIEDPIEYVRDVLARHNLLPTQLAKLVRISPSTLNRQLNDPNYKSVLSTVTLRKIRTFDRINQGSVA